MRDAPVNRTRRGLVVALLAFCTQLPAAPPEGLDDAQLPGRWRPEGDLLIVGGGDTPRVAAERFVALAGGAGRARIAIFPMASTAFDEEAGEVMAEFQTLGADVELVDFGRSAALSPLIARRLAGYTGYWFLGGDQNRLAATLLGTPALDALARRYRAGAVVGGTSAGAAVMSGVMLTGEMPSAPHPFMAGTDEDWQHVKRAGVGVAQGFGLLEGAIIDQHFLERGRDGRLFEAILRHPELLGVGIDEQTALHVRADGLWEVLGNSYVKILDARRASITVRSVQGISAASGISTHFIAHGNLFDPGTGRVITPEPSASR